jgi:cyclopropane fatty-acyl-phospholipid synthase-like methyltransferase
MDEDARGAARNRIAGRDIARYYDRNTPGFLTFGGGGKSYAIHRQLWGPAVRTAHDAARYINELIAAAIASQPGADAPTVLDLGCGVGGTLFDLAARLPGSELHGITISAKQYALAERLRAAHPQGARIHFSLGDFEQARLAIAANVIVAIESFAHSRAAELFFATAARHLKPNGRLILVDDFLAHSDTPLSARAQTLTDDFRTGWRIPGLGTVAECIAAAADAGLACTEQRDLTPMIRLTRPAHRITAALSPLLRRCGLIRVPFFANIIGGGALQLGLREGIFQYRWLTFGKR